MYVIGTVQSAEREAGAVAIAVNQTIRGTAHVTLEDGEGDFRIRVPPTSWNPGRNAISLYAIERDRSGGGRSLSKLAP